MTNAANFSANSDRLPPQNIEAEEAILGGILLDPEAISRVVELLRPENFAVQAHRTIYHAALTLHLQGKPTDLMTLTSWLADQNQLEKIGGQGKLAELVERTVSAVNIDQYGHLVLDKSTRRQLIQVGNQIVDLAYQTETALEQVLDQSEQLVFNLTQTRPQQALVPIGETLINTFQDIEDRNEGVTLPGIPCGFYDLDAMTGGFQRSDLIIVAGRPSMGKCLSQDAEIVLADGSIATIREIYHHKKAHLLTLTDNLTFKLTQPSAFIDDGLKPVFRVVTQLGRTIESTLTHPFLTSQGWQPLSELKIGDKIAVPRMINLFGTQKMSPLKVKFFSYCLANQIVLKKLLQKQSLIVNQDIFDVLVRLNIEKIYPIKLVPEIIFQLEKNLVALFINRLFAVEGQLIFVNRNRIQISYNSSCQKFLRQIQHLLVRFGIIACLRQSHKIYLLEITETQSIQRFIAEIGILGQEEILYQIKQILSLVKVRQNNVTSKRLKSLNLEKNEIYWDEIASIESLGLQQVYDLTIPETHNFVANDICVHNTSFAVGIAHNIAKEQGLPIAIYSLEMSKEQLVQRLLSSEAKIESNRLRSGRISQAEWEPLTMAIGTLSELGIFIDDTPNITVTEMRSKARRLQTEQGGALGLVLIDYLQLMEGSSSDNRVQELSRITRALKGLARELNVPVIALSQLSRGVEARTNKRPMMSDLRESGCLVGDTLVTLADTGQRVPIRELVGQSVFEVWALDEETLKMKAATVNNAFYTGTKPVFKLTTRLGRTIRATGNHKFRTINGWFRLDELTSGYRIALPRVLPEPYNICKATSSLFDKQLAIAAHLIGDGCTLPRHSIQYTTKEIELAEIVVNLSKEAFGNKIKTKIKQEHSWYQVYLSSNYKLTHGLRNPVAEWLDSWGIFGLRSYEKHVPDIVFTSLNEQVSLFIRHLWSTDGCLNLVKTKHGKSARPLAYYATSSQILAYDVQSLLLRLGISSRVKQISQQGKGRDAYQIIITGKQDIEQFLESIGTVGKRRSLMAEKIFQFNHDTIANTNRDIIPYEIWDKYVLPALSKSNFTHRMFQQALGHSYCGSSLYKQNISRERGNRIASILGSSALATLASSDVYWDEIISIEPDGEADVYDLTVEKYHNFVANNIIVHNSIEQDADLVIMLYRDDYYNPDTPDRGISEIIITKHRNGPTGTVKLLFDPQFTRFRNLAASERYSFPNNAPNQLPPG